MATAEQKIYLPTKSISIPVRRLDTLPLAYEGTDSPVIESEQRRGFRVVIKINPDDQDTNLSELIQVSEFHKRDFEIRRLPEYPHIWQDTFGNYYSSRFSIKSNNGSYPALFRQEPDNQVDTAYFVYGLQESTAIYRSFVVSQKLREAGIDTDYIFDIVQPQQLPYNGQLISLNEYKRMLIENMWAINAQEDERDTNTGKLIPRRRELLEVGEYLDDANMTFVMYKRAQQVPERFVDFTFVHSHLEFDRLLSHIFDYINAEELYKASQNSSYKPQHFSIYSGEDICRYFTEYFPKRLAKNVAKMHALGIAHHMLNGGNFSAIGSIYDTESPRGEVLGIGDSEVTQAEIAKDVHSIFKGITGYAGIDSIINFLQEKRYIGENISTRKIRNIFDREYSQIIGEALLKEVKAKGWEDSLLENIVSIYKMFDLFAPTAENYLIIAEYLKKLLAKEIPLPEVEIDLEEWVEQFMHDERIDLSKKIESALQHADTSQYAQVIDKVFDPVGDYPESAADRFFAHARFGITFQYMDNFSMQSDTISNKFSDDHLTAVVGIAIAKAITVAYRFCYDEPYNNAGAIEEEMTRMKQELKERYLVVK